MKTSLADLSVQFGQITANQYGGLPIPHCQSESAALAGEYYRGRNHHSGTTYFEGLWIAETMLCTDREKVVLLCWQSQLSESSDCLPGVDRSPLVVVMGPAQSTPWKQ